MLLSIHSIRYLDPGSGSLLIQLLAAGLLGGIGILIKTFWRQIKGFITGKKDKTLVTKEEEEENPDDKPQ